MKSKYSILLVVFTIICFVISILEINTEYISNTFDDQYDSYVQPDNVAQPTVEKIVENFVPRYATLLRLIYFPVSELTGYLSACLLTEPSDQIPVKRFILNRVLLI